MLEAMTRGATMAVWGKAGLIASNSRWVGRLVSYFL
jgi:hypothetical protein